MSIPSPANESLPSRFESPPVRGEGPVVRPVHFPAGIFIVPLALVIGYVFTYLTLSALGSYSDQRYASRVETEAAKGGYLPDESIWQPKFIVCEPQGSKPYIQNFPGYIYFPLVFLDRSVWHESIGLPAPNPDGEATNPIITHPDSIYYSILTLALGTAVLYTGFIFFRKMGESRIQRAPYLPCLILFGIPVGWLAFMSLVYYLPVISAKAHLVVLAVIAPGVTLIASIYLAELPERTAYHRWALWLGFFYPAMVVLSVIAATIIEHW